MAKSSGIFSETERLQVEAAIGRAEAGSSAEIVVVAAPESDDYSLARALVGFDVALMGAVVVALWAPAWPWWLMLLVEVPAAVLGYGLTRGALLRWLLPAAVEEAAVRGAALRLFAERGVANTTGRTGILVYLSELEHRAVILGDIGIAAKIDAAGWQTYIDRIVTGVRGGNAGSAVVAVIDDLAALVAREFPRNADDRNELADTVTS